MPGSGFSKKLPVRIEGFLLSETPRQFIQRLLIFSVGPICSAIIGFISVPITTWLVAPDDFGKASMFTVFHMLASIIIFMGLDQALLREFHAFDDKRKLFLNSIMLPLIFSVAFTGISLVFYRPISRGLFGTESLIAIAATALPIPFLVIKRFNLLIVRVEENARLYSVFLIFERILHVFLLVGIVYFHRNYLGVITAQCMGICLSAVVSQKLVRSYWKTGSFLDRAIFRKLLRFGLPLVPATILGWALNAMDKVALRLWTDFSEMGIYAAGFRIVSALLLFQAAFTTFWVPTAYRWYESGVSKEKFEKVGTFLSFFLCFIGGSVIVLRRAVILIFAPAYAPAMIVVPFLIFYPVLYSLSEVTVIGIVFTRKTELGIWISLAAAGTNLLGNWMLVPEYGALGASVATAISYMVFFWMRTLLSRSVWEKTSVTPHIANLSLLTAISVTAGLQDLSILTGSVSSGIFLILFFGLFLYNAPHLVNMKKILLAWGK